MSVAARVPQETASPDEALQPKARLRPQIKDIALPVVRAKMHPGVHKVAFACWVAFLCIFWLTFFISANALFMVVISTVHAVVFFGVPWIMNRMAPKPPAPASDLTSFLTERVETLYGPIGGFEALLQVIIVPLSLTIGGIAIALIIHWARALH